MREQPVEPPRCQADVGVDEGDEGRGDRPETGVAGDGRSGIGAQAEDAGAVDGMPSRDETTFLESAGVTRLVDSSGTSVMFTVSDPLGSQRQWIRLDTLPRAVVDATLTVEDPDFLETTSFDPAGTLVRLWRNIMDGPIEADQSLTARLVRNVVAPLPETVGAADRGREIALVAEINRLYTPTEVLEWHLNTNYYGNEAYGIEAAARVYLGKRAGELSLAEAALLASIPTAPWAKLKMPVVV